MFKKGDIVTFRRDSVWYNYVFRKDGKEYPYKNQNAVVVEITEEYAYIRFADKKLDKALEWENGGGFESSDLILNTKLHKALA